MSTSTDSGPDIGDTIAPKSDQMNADDLLTGPRTFTISRVVVKQRTESDVVDQPVWIYLEEFPERRPFKPSKGMRRVMVAGWGKRSADYVGHRFTLFRDPTVMYAGAEVAGIRISHMSHLPDNKPLMLSLTKNQAQREPYKVLVLADDAVPSPVVSERTLATMVGLFDRKGVAEGQRLTGVNAIIRGSATALETITETEAGQVIAVLEARPDPAPAAAAAPDPAAPAPDAPHAYVNDPDAGTCAVRLSDGSVCGELEDRAPHVAADEPLPES